MDEKKLKTAIAFVREAAGRAFEDPTPENIRYLEHSLDEWRAFKTDLLLERLRHG